MSDPYDILGVSKSDTDAEIKSAYRRLAKKHHPDTDGGDQQKFAQISTAYDSIKNADARQNFESSKFDPSNFQQSQSPFEHQFGNFDDVFNQMFANRPVRKQNTSLVYHVEIQDVFNGALKSLNISMPNGNSKPINIRIPKGIQSNEEVMYQGMAPNGADLLITFIIKGHKDYYADGYNIVKTMQISLKEAMIGTEKIVQTLDNRKIKLHIKSGTQSGTKLRIPENGLPKRNRPNGDYIIELQIKIPKLLNEDLDKTLNQVL